MILEHLSYTVFALLLLASLISLALQRTLLTTSVLLLGVWSLVILAKYYQNAYFNFDAAPTESYELLLQGVVGMALGCMVMQVLLRRPRQSANQVAAYYASLPSWLDRAFPAIFWITFLSGMAAFVSNGGGFNFSLSNLDTLRDAYVNDGGDIFTRIARYATNLAFAGVVLLALSDFSQGKVSSARIMLLCIAVLPLSLSKASRIEFVQVALHYFSAAFLLASLVPVDRMQRVLRKVFLRRVTVRGMMVLLGISVLFSVIGLARSAGKSVYSHVEGVVDSVLFPISSYIAGSVNSVGYISHWIEANIGPSYGGQYFEFFHKLLSAVLGSETENSKALVRMAYDDIGAIAIMPGSFVRYLVADFGIAALPYVSFCIGAFSTLVVLRTKMTSLLMFAFCVIVTYELLYSFQTIGLFSVANFYKLIVFALISYSFNKHRRKVVTIPFISTSSPASTIGQS